MTPSSASAPIRVFIVEDHPPMQEELNEIVCEHSDYQCCGIASGTSEVDSIVAALPDVVLLDLSLQGESGLGLLEKLKSRLPDTHILVYTQHDDTKRLFTALEYGASGYLLKPEPKERLLEAIKHVHGGGAPITPGIASHVIRSFRKRRLADARMETLTKRELEVLELVSEGLQNKEVAEQLEIDRRTVDCHVANIYSKLQVNRRTEAAKLFFRSSAS